MAVLCHRTTRAALLALALGLAPVTTPAAVADEDQVFDVYFNGLKGGTMTLSSHRTGNRYHAAGQVRSSGIVGAFHSFTFAGRSSGQVLRSGALRPYGYSAVGINGKDRREVQMSYRGGVPERIAFAPKRKPRAHDAAPASQRGTRDPISATLEILQSAPVGQACGKTVDVFDGTKRSRLRLEERRREGARWSCRGTYTRIQGWRKKDLDRKRNFAFKVFYREEGGVMRADGFETQTTFGLVRAVRR